MDGTPGLSDGHWGGFEAWIVNSNLFVGNSGTGALNILSGGAASANLGQRCQPGGRRRLRDGFRWRHAQQQSGPDRRARPATPEWSWCGTVRGLGLEQRTGNLIVGITGRGMLAIGSGGTVTAGL